MGLFTPDMAFESIVKEQIQKLLNPSLTCVDLVSTELGAVVQKCADGVSGRGGKGRDGSNITYLHFHRWRSTLD